MGTVSAPLLHCQACWMCSRSLGARGGRSSRTAEKVRLCARLPALLSVYRTRPGVSIHSAPPAWCAPQFDHPRRLHPSQSASNPLSNATLPLWHPAGIIITTHDKLAHYLGMLTHQVPIESQFIAGLVDHLNAEIVLGTVRWLRWAGWLQTPRTAGCWRLFFVFWRRSFICWL